LRIRRSLDARAYFPPDTARVTTVSDVDDREARSVLLWRIRQRLQAEDVTRSRRTPVNRGSR